MTSTPDCLFDSPLAPRATLILAHGAGQPMDSPFLDAIATRIANNPVFAVEVARFNFPYMIRAQAQGKALPPDRAEILLASWRQVIAALRQRNRQLFIGGKSMGGRYASMVALQEKVDGVICLGYPFHPPGRSDRLRIAHLENMATPTLIVQGERDHFGRLDEVKTYPVSQRIDIRWMTDGDHDFRPRKSSGATVEENLEIAARTVVEFMAATQGD